MLSQAAADEIEKAIHAILSRHGIPAAVVFAITSVHEPATRLEIDTRIGGHTVSVFKRNKKDRDTMKWLAKTT